MTRSATRVRRLGWPAIVALVAALVPTALVLGATRAGATSASVVDPAGDVSVTFGSPSQATIDRTDLTGGSVDVTASTVTFSATTVAAAADPSAAGFSIKWTFDTTGAGSPTGFVDAASGHVWFLDTKTGFFGPICTTTVTADSAGYHVSFPSACIGHPYELSFSLSASIDADGSASDSTATSSYATVDGWAPTLPGHNPVGSFDSATIGPALMPGGKLESIASALVSGWAIDPDSGTPIPVDIYVDGHMVMRVTADLVRWDVGTAYPGYGAAHGFSTTIPIASTGSHTICAYAINAGPGTSNPSLGCHTLVAPNSLEWGHLEGLSVSALDQSATVWGWYIYLVGTPGRVGLFVDGKGVGNAYSTLDDPLVRKLYPSFPNNSWRTTIPVPAGTHTICAYGITWGYFAQGCKTVTVGGNPIGHLDSVTSGVVGRALVSGWAIDPDTGLAIDVDIWVDGHYSTTLDADSPRVDVGTAEPGYGANHGFTGWITTGSGTHTLCAYGINTGFGTANSLLGCRQVAVP